MGKKERMTRSSGIEGRVHMEQFVALPVRQCLRRNPTREAYLVTNHSGLSGQLGQAASSLSNLLTEPRKEEQHRQSRDLCCPHRTIGEETIGVSFPHRCNC